MRYTCLDLDAGIKLRRTQSFGITAAHSKQVSGNLKTVFYGFQMSKRIDTTSN